MEHAEFDAKVARALFDSGRDLRDREGKSSVGDRTYWADISPSVWEADAPYTLTDPAPLTDEQAEAAAKAGAFHLKCADGGWYIVPDPSRAAEDERDPHCDRCDGEGWYMEHGSDQRYQCECSPAENEPEFDVVNVSGNIPRDVVQRMLDKAYENGRVDAASQEPMDAPCVDEYERMALEDMGVLEEEEPFGEGEPDPLADKINSLIVDAAKLACECPTFAEKVLRLFVHGEGE